MTTAFCGNKKIIAQCWRNDRFDQIYTILTITTCQPIRLSAIKICTTVHSYLVQRFCECFFCEKNVVKWWVWSVLRALSASLM